VGPEIGLGLPPILPALGVMFMGLLMVSPIPYNSFKNLRFGQSYSSTVIPVVISIFLIMEPELSFFLVGLVYVGSGPLGYLWRRRTGRTLLPADDPASGGASTEGRSAKGAKGESTSTSSDRSPEATVDGNGKVTPLSDRVRSESTQSAGSTRGKDQR